MKNFIVSDVQGAKRIDTFAAEKINELSRSSVRKLVDEEKIKVNKRPVKASYKLRTGDRVSIDFDIDEASVIPNIELPIIFENSDCIVIDKPAGILTHSKGAFNPEATVATFIAPKITNMTGDRAGIVHRLDRATSGLIICAKNPESQKWLQKQFSLRKVKKTYYAVIEGKLTPEKAIIDMPIERHPRHPQTFRAGVSGKPAQTEYETVKSSKTFSLLKLLPRTGRTHQLRVHLSQLRHPIIGDSFYDGKKYKRLLLHAETLEITLPDSTRMVFHSKLPSEFNKILQ